jgi:hypothetical protein
MKAQFERFFSFLIEIQIKMKIISIELKYWQSTKYEYFYRSFGQRERPFL